MTFLDLIQTDGNLMLINLLLQVTLLSALALLIAAGFRHNAAARYGVLYPAMLSLLVLVGASLLLQSWTSSPLRIAVQTDPVATATGEAAEQFRYDEFPPPALDLDLALLNQFTEDGAPSAVPASGVREPGLLAAIPFYLLFEITWLAGLLCMTFGLLRSLSRIDSLAGRARHLNREERRRLRAVRPPLPPEMAEISLRTCRDLSGPMLTGLGRPLLLLPENFIASLTEEQLRAVILHELAHYQRRDALANFLQKIVLALFWFHPLVHVMDRQISRAREEICDNYVLKEQPPLSYGETLLRVSTLGDGTGRRQAAANAMGMFGGEWRLENRISELLDENRERTMKLSKGVRRLFTLGTLAGALLVSACQLSLAQPAEDGVTTGAAEDSTAAPLLAQQQPVQEQRTAQEQQAAQGRREMELQMRQLESEANQLAREIEQRQAQLEQQARRMQQELEQRAAEVEQQELALRQELEQRQRALQEEATRLEQEALRRQQELQARQRELNEQLQQRQQGNDADGAAFPTPPPGDQTGDPRFIQAQSTQSAEPRQPPQARTASTLGEEVMAAISRIQDMMVPADDSDPDLAAIRSALDALRNSRWESMNDFEKSTLLNFYTNYYLMADDYAGAIATFEEILTLENLREDIRLRTLRSLGQLYAAEEYWPQSLQYYDRWRDLSETEDELVYRGLSYAHYRMEEYASALPYWLNYMDFKINTGEELEREDYAYLNGLYFTLERFDEALSNTKEMILLFNDPKDWENLRAIFKSLDAQAEADRAEQELIGALSGQDSNPDIDEARVSATDGDYLPVVAIAPQYPTRAAQQGIEGWVLVQFTVDEAGAVNEDSITVVDAEPADIFNRSSMRAASLFKFQPRVENGVGVAVPGVQYLFRYALNDEDDV